jgi:hypothetical protein
MNVTKIQTDVLKDVLADKARKWFISITADEVAIMTGTHVYILDHKDYVLDTKKLLQLGVKEVTTINQILDAYDKAKPLVKTPNKRVLDVATCLELKLGDESIYVDEALLKNFDKNIEFEGTGAKAPVYIYEGDLLVGVVLPVKVG